MSYIILFGVLSLQRNRKIEKESKSRMILICSVFNFTFPDGYADKRIPAAVIAQHKFNHIRRHLLLLPVLYIIILYFTFYITACIQLHITRFFRNHKHTQQLSPIYINNNPQEQSNIRERKRGVCRWVS